MAPDNNCDPIPSKSLISPDIGHSAGEPAVQLARALSAPGGLILEAGGRFCQMDPADEEVFPAKQHFELFTRSVLDF